MDTVSENTVKELNDGAALMTASDSVPPETVVFPEPIISLMPLGLDDSASTQGEIDQTGSVDPITAVASTGITTLHNLPHANIAETLNSVIENEERQAVGEEKTAAESSSRIIDQSPSITKKGSLEERAVLGDEASSPCKRKRDSTPEPVPEIEDDGLDYLFEEGFEVEDFQPASTSTPQQSDETPEVGSTSVTVSDPFEDNFEAPKPKRVKITGPKSENSGTAATKTASKGAFKNTGAAYKKMVASFRANASVSENFSVPGKFELAKIQPTEVLPKRVFPAMNPNRTRPASGSLSRPNVKPREFLSEDRPNDASESSIISPGNYLSSPKKERMSWYEDNNQTLVQIASMKARYIGGFRGTIIPFQNVLDDPAGYPHITFKLLEDPTKVQVRMKDLSAADIKELGKVRKAQATQQARAEKKREKDLRAIRNGRVTKKALGNSRRS